MGDRATTSTIDDHPEAGEPLDLLRDLARALGRQAARQMWAEALRVGAAMPVPETKPVLQSRQRSSRCHAGR